MAIGRHSITGRTEARSVLLMNDRPSTTTSALTPPSHKYPALSVQVSHPAHLNRWITPAN